MQRWGPTPNARWGLASRSRITSSGWSKTVSSRLADSQLSIRWSPRSRDWPPSLRRGHRAGQGLVDREETQELLGGGGQEGGLGDEAGAEVGVGVEVVQRQGEGRRGVQAAADEGSTGLTWSSSSLPYRPSTSMETSW